METVAGLIDARRRRGGRDDDAIGSFRDNEIHFAMTDGQRMAKRDEVSGFFCGEDAGNACHSQDISFRHGLFFDQIQSG
jgi:hypothetical protein